MFFDTELRRFRIPKTSWKTCLSSVGSLLPDRRSSMVPERDDKQLLVAAD